jgi:hypothetical protein
MNQNSSTDTSISSQNGISAEAISHRAYEIWEREGRPEGCDLRHWLQAEQELGIRRSDSPTESNGSSERATSSISSSTSSASSSTGPRNTGTDTRPLQGTRAGAATSSNRDQKRSSGSPFGDKATSSSNGQNAAKRKPANAPVL